MSKRSAGVDIETTRTSQRGVYCGAWSAYVPEEEHVYEASVRVTRPSRFFVLDADAFALFMKTEFPMAVHLVEGHKVGGLRQRQIIGQREKLLALGTITAGLTHQLNNPAAATARAAADLRSRVSKMRNKLALLADGKFTPKAMRALLSIQDEVAEQVAKAKPLELTALETSDREDQVGDWLEDHGIADAWDYAPTFVEAGLDIDWLEKVSATAAEAGATFELRKAIGWLKYTIDTEQLMKEILEASKRISELLAGAKQYSQMDRAPYGAADIHQSLHSTLMMFGGRVGKDTPVKLVKEYDKSLPELLCFPGDLNQVWTNIIDNAIQAMGGAWHADSSHDARRRRHGPRRDLRRRTGYPRRHRQPDLHTVLHHKAVRRGHRPRPGSGVANRGRKSTTATCASSRSPATPGSSSCCRWPHPRPKHRHPWRFRQTRNSRRRSRSWSRHDRYRHTQPRTLWILRSAESPPTRPNRLKPSATAPSGSAVLHRPNSTGSSRFWRRPPRCRWPPASSTSGPRPPGRSRSHSTASTRPTPDDFCWASASGIPKRSPNTASPSTP